MPQHDTTAEKRRYFAAGRMFRGWPPALLDEGAEQATLRVFQAGRTVLALGEKIDGFFLIGEGLIEVGSGAIDGRAHTRRYGYPGSAFGLLSMFDGAGSPYTYVAAENTILVFISRPWLQSALARSPAQWNKIIENFCEFQRASIADIKDLVFKPVAQRLMHALLSLSLPNCEADGGLQTRLSQDQLAKLLAVSRQTVSKELQLFAQEGLIAIEYRRIRILDEAALRRRLTADE